MAKSVVIIPTALALLGSPAAACDLEGGYGRYSPFYGMAHKTPTQSQVVVDPSVAEVFAKVSQPAPSAEVQPVNDKNSSANTRPLTPENSARPNTATKPVKSL